MMSDLIRVLDPKYEPKDEYERILRWLGYLNKLLGIEVWGDNMRCVGESLVHQRFEGITKYQMGGQIPLERPTAFCGSLDEVLQLLENQKKQFEGKGAKIISQRVQRQATFELRLEE